MGWDFVLSLLRVQVQSLVRELRPCKLHGVTKKKAQPFGNLPVGGKSCADSSSCRLWKFWSQMGQGVNPTAHPLFHCMMAGIVPNFSEPLFSHL